MELALDKRTAGSGWYIMKGQKGAGSFLAKVYICYLLPSFILFFVYRACKNRKRFTKYMIELNVHLLLADGI